MAPARSTTSVCASINSKTRSAAAAACCRLALTRVSFLIGPYISSSAATNDGELARREPSGGDLGAAVPQGGDDGDPAQRLHQRRQQRQHPGHAHVGAVELIGGAAELAGLAVLGQERLDDAVSGEGFAGDVRQPLERLLAAVRHGAQPLAQPGQRVDDQRRRGHAHQGQAGIDVDEQGRIADHGQRLAGDVADGFRDRPLHLADVVVDPRQQLAGGAAGEERRRLPEDVFEQVGPQRPDHAVAEVVHQVAGEERADALDDVGGDDGAADEGQRLARRQHAVENRLDQPGQRRRGGAVQDHRRERAGDDPPVWSCVAEQAQQGIHQRVRGARSALRAGRCRPPAGAASALASATVPPTCR